MSLDCSRSSSTRPLRLVTTRKFWKEDDGWKYRNTSRTYDIGRFEWVLIDSRSDEIYIIILLYVLV